MSEENELKKLSKDEESALRIAQRFIDEEDFGFLQQLDRKT